MPAARAVCTHPESALETAKKNDRARARMGGRIALPRIRQWVVFNTSSIGRDGSRARRHATALREGVCLGGERDVAVAQERLFLAPPSNRARQAGLR